MLDRQRSRRMTNPPTTVKRKMLLNTRIIASYSRRRDVAKAKSSYLGKLNPLYCKVVFKPHHLLKFAFRKKFGMAVRMNWAQTVELECAEHHHYIDRIKGKARQGKARP